MLFLWLSLAVAVRAQGIGHGLAAYRSFSGQFIIQAPYAGVVAHPPQLQSNPRLVALDPTVLPVSCERLREIVSRQVGIAGPWRGKIFLVLYPAASAEDRVGISAQRYNDGWQYHVEIPDMVDRARYVRGMVQALLLEFANRGAGERSAEIPVWLVEAVVGEVLTSSELKVILPPPGSNPNGKAPVFNLVDRSEQKPPMAPVHDQLTRNKPMTFDQLSWPTSDCFTGERGEVYRTSAQLFLNQLLKLEDGRACLRLMLERLPGYYNWQFAMFDAFNKYFQSTLEVEKWWAVNVEQFTGRDLAQRWSRAESYRRLDECLRFGAPALSNNAPSRRSEVPLRTALQNWDSPTHVQLAAGALSELELMRVRVADDALPLLQKYILVLRTYLQDREHAGLPFGLRKQVSRRHLAERAAKQLAELDALRAAEEKGTSSSTANGHGPA